MSTPAPGWYPDAQGTMRWWDGYRWTVDIQPPVASAPRVPEGTPTGTVWIWLIVLMPLVSLIPTIGYLTDLQRRILEMMTQLQTLDPTQPGYTQQLLGDEMAGVWTPWYVALLALGIVIYALTVVFAYLDWRTLARRGFAGPFHWAWAFLVAPWIYLIGRSVIVRRQSGRGLAPLWTFIAIEAAAFVLAMIWAGLFITQVTQNIGGIVGSLPS